MKSGAQLWPYGIIGTFAIFIAGLATYVVFAVTNDVELVADDYYAREIVYGAEMERLARVQALGDAFKFEGPTENKQLVLRLPSQHITQGATGTIQFYRPNNESLDQSRPLSPNSTGEQLIDLSTLPSGKWKIDIQWRSGNLDFQHRQTLILTDTGPGSDA